MEPMLETIDLDTEESNELAFKIKIEGADSGPTKVRLVCEGENVSYMFNGRATSEDGVVQFVIPVMKDKLKEGTYTSKVEVLVENRYFAPVQFNINFKKAMKVVAEAVTLPRHVAKPEIKVSAQPIVVTKPSVTTSHVTPAVHVKPEPVMPGPKTATLRERYEKKQDEPVRPTQRKQRPVVVDDSDQELIHDLAKLMTNDRRLRGR